MFSSWGVALALPLPKWYTAACINDFDDVVALALPLPKWYATYGVSPNSCIVALALPLPKGYVERGDLQNCLCQSPRTSALPIVTL